jgi:hypothetical protein
LIKFSSGRSDSHEPSGTFLCSVIIDQPKSVGEWASSPDKCHNVPVAQKTHRYIDNGWPTRDPEDHPVSELASDRVGALSPFGDVTFPLPATDLPYVHPVTVVNK